MDKYTVYMHTTPSGKKYIGITKNNPEKRWKNGNGYSGNDYFMKAIKKYGWGKIQHDILFENLSRDEACSKEIELIKYYKSNIREFGYNISSGGETHSGVKASPETIEKLRESHLGLKQNNETKFKKSIALKLYHKNNPRPKEMYIRIGEKQKGKYVSDSTRNKLSIINRGKKNPSASRPRTDKEKIHLSEINKGSNNPNARQVICLETMIVYPTIKDASEKTNSRATGIIGVCKKEKHTTNGLHWSYYDSELTNDYYKNLLIDIELKRIENRKLHGYKNAVSRSIKVECVELNAVYNSVKKASESLGISESGIVKCCKGKRETSGGYHWRYAV